MLVLIPWFDIFRRKISADFDNRVSLWLSWKNLKMFHVYIYIYVYMKYTWKFSAINVQILSWITVYLSDSNTFVSHDCVVFTWESCARVRLELCQIGDSFCSKWRVSWLREAAMQFELTERLLARCRASWKLSECFCFWSVGSEALHNSRLLFNFLRYLSTQ